MNAGTAAKLGGLAALVALLALASLVAGPTSLAGAAWFDPADPRTVILWQLRAPRTALGVLVGAALGASGAAMQGYTRNPLADPGVLGVSSTAALGAVISLYFGFSAHIAWATPVAAMAGAAVGLAALLALAGRASTVVGFLLAGVIIQAAAGAGVALALNLSPNPWAAGEIIDWLMGSLADRSLDDVILSAPFIFAGLALVFVCGRMLDALTLGEEGARSLGVPIGRSRVVLSLGVALAVGASVAVTGVIGFVGLIVPHLLRPLFGARPGALLVPSALGGAALVLAADILVRLTPSAVELRLGVAMAALGAPFFLALLILRRRSLA